MLNASARNRLILWLASGLFVVAVVVAVSSRRPADTPPVGPTDRALARWLRSSGALDDEPGLSDAAEAHRDPSVEKDQSLPGGEGDELLFAMVDRLERQTAAAMNRARESVVTLEYSEAGAADEDRNAAVGVVVDGRRGAVLAVRIDRPGAVPIVARDAFGRRLLAQWIAADPDTGLTLLEIPPGVLRSIQPSAEGPALGSQVFVVGNPFGLGHSISRGQISGLDRALKLRDHQINGLIQVRSPISPGDTGAAVVNHRGQWLGLVRGVDAHAADRAEGHDLGFAIPADDALWIAEQLRERGRVDRAYLGVRLAPDLGDPTAPDGAPLRDVLPDTPAARAGLRPGERVVSFDGGPIRSSADLTQRLDLTPAERFVRLEIVHDGPGPQRSRRSVWVRVDRRPEPPALAEKKPAASSPVITPTSAVAPPRAAVDRLDRIERRLDRLERERSAPPPVANDP